jgi:hypothetical protein
MGIHTLLEMVMEILALVGNFPITSCVVLFNGTEKSVVNAWIFLPLTPRNKPLGKCAMKKKTFL